MIQASDIRLSVHENCAFNRNDRYHVRVYVTTAQIRTFLEAYVRYGWDHEGDYEATGGWFMLGGHKFTIDMGEYDSRGLEDNPAPEGIVYFTVSTGNLYLQVRPHSEGWIIDMSPEKDCSDFERTDGTRYPREIPLPIDFWVEPAAVIRAILGKGGH
jgi:hypothetical protein